MAEGGRSVTVRVTGRWRRRRPELRGQAMLVVETGHGPAAVRGDARASLADRRGPGDVATELHRAGRARAAAGWQDVPAAGGGDGAAPGRRGVGPGEEVASEDPDSAPIEARRPAAQSSRPSAPAGAPPRAEATAGRARSPGRVRSRTSWRRRGRSPTGCADEIAERERRLRGAEQHVHAERALRRSEVEQALSQKTRAAGHDLRVLHDHVADLERELARTRRAVDEAQHLAAAAHAARAEAERRLAERPPPAPEPPAPEPPALEPAGAANRRRRRPTQPPRSTGPGRRESRQSSRWPEQRRCAEPRPRFESRRHAPPTAGAPPRIGDGRASRRRPRARARRGAPRACRRPPRPCPRPP